MLATGSPAAPRARSEDEQAVDLLRVLVAEEPAKLAPDLLRCAKDLVIVVRPHHRPPIVTSDPNIGERRPVVRRRVICDIRIGIRVKDERAIQRLGPGRSEGMTARW